MLCATLELYVLGVLRLLVHFQASPFPESADFSVPSV